MLVQRSSVQLRNERLDGKEGSQDTSEDRDKSEDNRDTGCHTGRSMEVLLQRSAGIADVVMSKFLDTEGTVSSPPDRDLALEDPPVFHEDGGP